VLAVDGGGSKLDAALLRRDGTLLGAARHHVDDAYEDPGSDAHMSQVVDAARAAARDAGLDPDRLPFADLGVYCLAGADLRSDDRRITAWLRRHRLTDSDVVRNDTFAVLRAGTERPWGVGVVCGFGTNCSGVSPTGRIFRLPAIGPISGDFGGGGDLGGLALWFAIRDEDGRGAPTSLRRSVPAHFDLRRPHQVMEALYRGRLDEHRLAELAPLVFREAAKGDAVALDLIHRQADEIVTMAGAAITRLRMRHLDVDVVLGGGVFRNTWRPFYERIELGLHEIAPRSQVHVLSAPPVVGAALMGLDRTGGSKPAQRRLRAGLTHRRLSAHTGRRRKEP
jgi:N-acetylglucosamine kinase-like BadF-type ATPase